MDPAALRRRNMIRPEQMPYTNAMGQIYDSGTFEKILDQGLALADWNGFAARREESKAARQAARPRHRHLPRVDRRQCASRRRSRSTSPPTASSRSTRRRRRWARASQTSYAQLAVDVFGVPIEKIRIVQGDTDRGNGFGSAGSRSLFTGGSAVKVGAERTDRRRRKELAGEALEAAAADIEYRAGRFAVVGTDLGIDLFELAGKQPERAHPRRRDQRPRAGRPGRTPAMSARSRSIPADRRRARSSPTRRSTTSAASSARRSSRGQVDGGAVQGIGQALCEQIVYDARQRPAR